MNFFLKVKVSLKEDWLTKALQSGLIWVNFKLALQIKEDRSVGQKTIQSILIQTPDQLIFMVWCSTTDEVVLSVDNSIWITVTLLRHSIMKSRAVQAQL